MTPQRSVTRAIRARRQTKMTVRGSGRPICELSTGLPGGSFVQVGRTSRHWHRQLRLDPDSGKAQIGTREPNPSRRDAFSQARNPCAGFGFGGHPCRAAGYAPGRYRLGQPVPAARRFEWGAAKPGWLALDPAAPRADGRAQAWRATARPSATVGGDLRYSVMGGRRSPLPGHRPVVTIAASLNAGDLGRCPAPPSSGNRASGGKWPPPPGQPGGCEDRPRQEPPAQPSVHRSAGMIRTPCGSRTPVSSGSP
jgi:hypothetical protein